MKLKRRIVFISIAALIITLLLWKKQRVQYFVLSWMVHHEKVPNELALREVVDGAKDPAEALEGLWDTGQIVHREFVACFLREKSFSRIMPSLWPRLRPQMLEGARGGDIETQEAALAVLREQADPQAVPLALAMLADVDPGVRRVGAISLQQVTDKNFAPVFARLLDDPDHFVRSLAANSVSSLTEHEVGINSIEAESKNLAAIRAWREWWEHNKEQFTAISLPAPADSCCEPMGSAPDFALPDLEGKTLRLSTLKGKPVLMVFWATWSPLCVDEIPDLVEFNRRCANEVQLVSVDVDNQADMTSGGRVSSGPMLGLVDRVKQFAAERRINYPVLIDKDSTALGPYNGGDLPVAVLIDKDGIVRRRFLGGRSPDVLAQMIAWLNHPAQSAVSEQPAAAGPAGPPQALPPPTAGSLP